MGRRSQAGRAAAEEHLLERRLTTRRVYAAIPIVPEYDAFGREIGDDPLAGLRDAVNPPPPKPQPVAAQPEAVFAASDPEPAVAAPPRPQFVRPRRRRRGGLAGLLLIVSIVAAIGIVGNAAVEKGNDFIEQITPEQLAPPEEGPPPTGLQADSLIREENFADALNALVMSRKGEPLSIRVAPERIDASLVRGRRLHQVQITPDGALRELATTEAPGNLHPVAFSKIDPAAPERLTRAGATRKQPARSINYLVLTPTVPATWGAYYKRGRIVIGDAHGKPQRVI
jgi:hypothetical protein